MSIPGAEQLILAQAVPGGGMTSFVPLILILGVFYFLLIRPQQKRTKEHEDFVRALKRGDKVVTGSGLYAKVLEVRDHDVTLEIAPKVQIRYERSKVAALQNADKKD